jgi:hypothetical protein
MTEFYNKHAYVIPFMDIIVHCRRYGVRSTAVAYRAGVMGFWGVQLPSPTPDIQKF